MNPANMKGKLIRGTGFLLGANVLAKVVSLCGHILLARFLIPDDFGVYAVAAFVVTFFMSLFANGLPAALLQKKEEIRESELRDFFTLQQLVALTLYAFIWFGAPAISGYFGTSAINASYIRVFGTVIIIASIRAFPCVLLERELDYKSLGMVELSETIGFQSSTVFFAWTGHGAWSFVWGMLIGRGLSLLVAWILAGRIPRFGFKWGFMKETFLFGVFMQLGNVFNLFRDAIIPIYLGKRFGMEGSGYANWAWLLATHPMFIAYIFERTSYSTLSRLQDQPERFARATEQFFFINNIIVPCFMTMIVAQATGIVHFIFTDKWLPTIPLIYLISFYVFLFASGNISINAINALGKSRFTFLMSAWIFGFYLLGTIVFTHYFGVNGYGLAVITGSFNYLILYAYLKRLVRVRLSAGLFPALTASLISGTIGYTLSHYILPQTFLNFVCATALTGAIYVGLISLAFRRRLAAILRDVFVQFRPSTVAEVLDPAKIS